MLSIDFGDKNSNFMNFLEMNEIVLPFKWHSFCISLSPDKALIFHNGKKQGVLSFKSTKNLPLLNYGILGGTKFKGIIADFNMFGHLLSEEKLSVWTLCGNNKERYHFHPLANYLLLYTAK